MRSQTIEEAILSKNRCVGGVMDGRDEISEIDANLKLLEDAIHA